MESKPYEAVPPDLTELMEQDESPAPVQDARCITDEERRMRFGNNRKHVTRAHTNIRKKIAKASKRRNRK